MKTFEKKSLEKLNNIRIIKSDDYNMISGGVSDDCKCYERKSDTCPLVLANISTEWGCSIDCCIILKRRFYKYLDGDIQSCGGKPNKKNNTKIIINGFGNQESLSDKDQNYFTNLGFSLWEM